jgi:hypothetical protein
MHSKDHSTNRKEGRQAVRKFISLGGLQLATGWLTIQLSFAE